MLRSLTTLALLLTPPGTPSGGFHWQRIITPPAGAPTAPACVVLDAATFANAAPALGDLRLFQDGNELPYVIEESYDDRALNSRVTPNDDRSEYEVVASGIARPVSTGTAQILFTIDPRVPVERIRIEPAPTTMHHLQVEAGELGKATGTESVTQDLAIAQSAFAFTLGANLQHAAQLRLTDTASGLTNERIVAEMRRRSLCYQPRSASPLVLYLGGGQGIAAKVYGPSKDFSSALERPYATLGPLEPNPDQQRRAHHPISRLLVAIAVLAATLLLTLWVGLELARKEKSLRKAANS